MNERLIYAMALGLSLLIAWFGATAPNTRPIDYDAIMSRSVPLAVVWAALLAICLWRYRKRGLWLLLGSPMAFYWPIWRVFHHLPSCYYSGNCV
jgi:FtsH-binding integral membrane protein